MDGFSTQRKRWELYYSGRTVVGALGTGGGTLVAGVARDTHDCRFCRRRRGGD